MEKGTLHEALLESAGRHGGRAAFTFPDDGGWAHVTYAEFAGMARAFSAYLRGEGVEKGDRVALVSENRVQWCAAYLGILASGAVAVPVDARLTPGETRNILLDSEARCVVHLQETASAVAEASSGLPVRAVDLDSFDWSPSPMDEEAEVSGGDLASLIYTSGTTGSPKGVMLTHENLLSDARAVMQARVITETDRVASVLPLHHTYAFMCTFVVPVLAGGAVTYPAGLKGPDIVKAVKETGVTVLVGVPQLLELMLKRTKERIQALPLPASWVVRGFIRLAGFLRRRLGANISGRVFSPLGRQFRFFTSGGARLAPEVMEGLEALGFTVLEGYGLTETSPIVSFNPAGKRKPGSAGKAVPSAEIIITPPASGEAEEHAGHAVGEVAVRGPMVMKGYYRRPRETAEVLSDGWFRTGDLGYLDDEGYLFITGRLKEVIVLASGKNVYPEEVEKHYLGSPLIKEMCVLERDGRLHAVVAPDMAEARARGVGNIHEALRWELTALAGGLPPHMRIKGFGISREPLPRTPLGKLRRFAVGEGITAGRPRGEEDRTLLGDETGRRVLAALSGFLAEGATPGPQDNLDLDLGLDSLNRVELSVALEREFSVTLPEGFTSTVHTVAELVDGIKGMSAGGEAAPEEGREGLGAVLLREPSHKEKKRAGIRRGPFDWPVTVFLACVLRMIMRAFYRLKVEGVENLPPPPFILAANHASYLDGFAIAACLPLKVYRRLYFLGERKYFSGRPMSLFGRLAHVISIDRDARLGLALELSSFVLRGGGALSVFPEGGRSVDGEVMQFKKGIGILALSLNVPVVPARIEGTFEAFPRGAFWPRPGRIRLVIGKPLSPADAEPPPGGVDAHRSFAGEVRQRVVALAPR
jgi:long-chain acyl-CoA synthetase